MHIYIYTHTHTIQMYTISSMYVIILIYTFETILVYTVEKVLSAGFIEETSLGKLKSVSKKYKTERSVFKT